MGSQNSLQLSENQQNHFVNGQQSGKNGQNIPQDAAAQFAAQAYQTQARVAAQQQQAQMAAQARARNHSGISDGGSSSAAAPSHQSQTTAQLSEQNMMKIIGAVDPRLGSAFDGSSNSGSDMTLRLFDRLRAQQQKQKEQKDRHEKDKMHPHQSPQSITGSNMQVDQAQLQTLFQNMISMTPAQQQDYLHQIVQQQLLQQQQQQQIQMQMPQSQQQQQMLTDQLYSLHQQFQQYQQSQQMQHQYDQNMQMLQYQQQLQQQQKDNQSMSGSTQNSAAGTRQQNATFQNQTQPGQFGTGSQTDQQSMNAQLQFQAAQQAIQAQLEQQQNKLLNKVEHIFEWSFGGENVEICAEFNNWQGERMGRITPGEPVKVGTGLVVLQGEKIGQQPPTHCCSKLLEPKRYEYKFRVDGHWRYAPDQAITRDNRGNENNVVDLTNSKTLLQCLQEQQASGNYQDQAQQYQQQQFLFDQLQQQLLQQSTYDAATQAQMMMNGQDSTEKQQLDQQQLLTQTLTSLLKQHQQQQHPGSFRLDPEQTLLMLQQQFANQQNQQQMQQLQIQQQHMMHQQQQEQISQQQLTQAQAQQIADAVSAQRSRQGSDAGGQPHMPPAVGNTDAAQAVSKPPRSTGKRSIGGATSTRGKSDIDQPLENIYHQVLPDETDEEIPEPQVLPIHFNYNFMDRESIPLHNDKYSRLNDSYQKDTEIIRKGYFDNTLPIPSHVILNHINSWETMQAIPPPKSTRSRRDTGVEETQVENVDQNQQEGPFSDDTNKITETQPQQGLTAISISQRLNRSKFLTMVYYKPSTNKY